MNASIPAYENLRARTHEIALLLSASNMLGWDQETYMPPAALGFRAEQLAYLHGRAHRIFTAPEVDEWIKACEQHGFPADGKEAANVREWRRGYDRHVKLPSALVEKMQRTTTLARDAWMEARRASTFPVFQPHLTEILQLSREMAEHWGYQEARYDALLEGYERGARARQLTELFAKLRPAIGEILREASAKTATTPPNLLAGDYPIASQQAFNREVAEAIGFDFQAGRIDTTTHPFCSELGPRDCRLTTRYNAADFTVSLYGILHEAGHGLYEQGLPREDYGTPAGSSVSLGIHESQSRLWENHVGRSRAFWEHWWPVACKHFAALAKFSPEEIVQSVNRVQPSFIRVEADEVTYDLHIMLRYELELQLIEGELAVGDLPAAWNEKFEQMLGLRVPNDALGCLQDIHWSLGSFGYFPTYTLGNLNASQLFRAALANDARIATEFAQGEYGGLLRWLRRHVHAHGQRLTPQELMKQATGEPTNAAYHLEHLREKI